MLFFEPDSQESIRFLDAFNQIYSAFAESTISVNGVDTQNLELLDQFKVEHYPTLIHIKGDTNCSEFDTYSGSFEDIT